MGNVFALTNVKTDVLSSSGERFFSSEIVFNSVILNSSSLPGPFTYNWQCLTECIVTSVDKKIDAVHLVMDFSKTQLPDELFLTSPIRAVGTVVINNHIYSASSIVTCTLNDQTIVFIVRVPCPKKVVDVALNCTLTQPSSS